MQRKIACDDIDIAQTESESDSRMKCESKPKHTKQQSNKIDKHGYQQNAENVEKKSDEHKEKEATTTAAAAAHQPKTEMHIDRQTQIRAKARFISKIETDNHFLMQCQQI